MKDIGKITIKNLNVVYGIAMIAVGILFCILRSSFVSAMLTVAGVMLAIVGAINLIGKKWVEGGIEIALGMQRLIEECHLTQDALSEKVGKKRSTVSNYMRLLKLPNEVQFALKEGLISMGHAKAIAGAPDELQVRLLKRCVRKGLSVRQLEELARAAAEKRSAAPADEEEYPESYARLVEQLEKLFTEQISIRRSKNGGGKIVIGFEDDAQIERILERFTSRN